MTDVAARIAAATAAGDVATLATLAIELANENARLAGHAAALEQAERDRKAAQAARTRKHRNGVSRDVTLQSVTERDVTDGNAPSPSPSPSLLPPTPPNNSSSPPSPASSSASEEFDAAAALLERIPEASRPAWAAQLRAAEQGLDGPVMSREKVLEACRDYLGNENLTGQRSLRHFRAYLASAAKAPAEKPRAIRGGEPLSVEAGNLVAEIREKIFDQPIPGQGTRRLLRNADVERMGEDVSKAYRTVGGASRFIALEQKPDDLPFLIRAFADALAVARRQLASTSQHAGAA